MNPILLSALILIANKMGDLILEQDKDRSKLDSVIFDLFIVSSHLSAERRGDALTEEMEIKVRGIIDNYNDIGGLE